MLTSTEAPGLFPASAGVREVAANFRHDESPVDAARALGIPLSESLLRSVPKRQAEYVAGRWCARGAIRALEPQFDGDIPSVDRAPQWPAGFVGSITHTTGFAWATVARASDARGVGIDAEKIPSVGGTDAIVRSVVAPGDSAPRPGAGPETAAIHYGLLFSAKESLFKCLHPIVQRMFWYQDAAIDVALDGSAQGTFRATLRIDLDAELRAGFAIEGRYAIAGERVSTAILFR